MDLSYEHFFEALVHASLDEGPVFVLPNVLESFEKLNLRNKSEPNK